MTPPMVCTVSPTSISAPCADRAACALRCWGLMKKKYPANTIRTRGRSVRRGFDFLVVLANRKTSAGKCVMGILQQGVCANETLLPAPRRSRPPGPARVPATAPGTPRWRSAADTGGIHDVDTASRQGKRMPPTQIAQKLARATFLQPGGAGLAPIVVHDALHRKQQPQMVGRVRGDDQHASARRRGTGSSGETSRGGGSR